MPAGFDSVSGGVAMPEQGANKGEKTADYKRTAKIDKIR